MNRGILLALGAYIFWGLHPKGKEGRGFKFLIIFNSRNTFERLGVVPINLCTRG